MPSLLKDFQLNKEMKKAVLEYLTDYLKEEGVRKIFDNEVVDGVREAKFIIDEAFDNLDILFPLKSEGGTVKPPEAR